MDTETIPISGNVLPGEENAAKDTEGTSVDVAVTDSGGALHSLKIKPEVFIADLRQPLGTNTAMEPQPFPERIEVVCGDTKGVMLVQTRRVLVEGLFALNTSLGCLISQNLVHWEPQVRLHFSNNPVDAGNEVSATDFEKISGRGASKKWKNSVHIVGADGRPGITIGAWLVVRALFYDSSRRKCLLQPCVHSTW